MASGSNLSPGYRSRQGGFRVPWPCRRQDYSGGFVRTEEDKNADLSARRQKTWAPRRRTGPRSWSLGVSAHYLHLFPKGDSDSTWARLEENQPRRLQARREGFLPAKNPSTSFSGCPRAPPWLIKGGPRQPRKGDRIQTNSAHKQGTSKKTGSALQADSF